MTKIKVETLIDTDQLQKDLEFSDTDLSTPMMQQASLFARYAVLCAKAGAQVDKLKMLRDIKYARLDQTFRDAAAAEGKKITEAQVSAKIDLTVDMVEFKKAVNEAVAIHELLKSACEAFRHRRDMLVQMGLMKREEYKGELTISRQQATAEQAQAQRDRVMARLSAPAGQA